MIRRPPRSTQGVSSAASDVYKRQVGGTTMRWSGITPRIQAHEFRARSTYGLLADTELIDWPLIYEEMDPYYDKAELRMGVTGTHDMPPSLETSNYKVLRAGGQKIGYKEITSGRTAINSIPYDGRPACLQIGFCHSGCRIGAKWSTLYTEVPKAEQTGHFELRIGMMAVRITTTMREKFRAWCTETATEFCTSRKPVP